MIFVKLEFWNLCEKSRQNERSYALCSLDVNKVSRILSWFLWNVKFCSCIQNCQEINQNWTLPIAFPKLLLSGFSNTQTVLGFKFATTTCCPSSDIATSCGLLTWAAPLIIASELWCVFRSYKNNLDFEGELGPPMMAKVLFELCTL